MTGAALFAPSVTRRLIEEFVRSRPTTDPPSPLESLSARELEVLTLIARGMSNQQIADELWVAWRAR
jgi:DNA-binding NarL/FixJ family response regulator